MADATAELLRADTSPDEGRQYAFNYACESLGLIADRLRQIKADTAEQRAAKIIKLN